MRHKFFSILFYRAKARGRNWSINTSPSFFKFHFNERQWHFSFLFRRKHQSRVHRFYVFIACAAQHPRPSIPTPGQWHSHSISPGRQSSQFSNSSTNSNTQRKLSFCVTSFDTYYIPLCTYIYIYILFKLKIVFYLLQ